MKIFRLIFRLTHIVLVSLFFLTICVFVSAQVDDPPQITDLYSNSTIVLINDMVKITAIATDDLGVSNISFSMPTVTITKNCDGNLTCSKEIEYSSGSTGRFEFCALAKDTGNQNSTRRCIQITFVPDQPPEIVIFDAMPKTVSVDGIVNFVIEAEDDLGVTKLYLKDKSTGDIKECQCTGLEKCSSTTCICLTEPCFKRKFEEGGIFEFCAWAQDTSYQNSTERCLKISVSELSNCTPIMLYNTYEYVPIAVRIESKKLTEEESGFNGYSAECCPYCNYIIVNNSNCEILEGDLSSFKRVIWNPQRENVHDILKNFTYIICENIIDENSIAIAAIDSNEYQPVDFIYNDEITKYWFIETGRYTTQKKRNINIHKIDALKRAAHGFVNVSLQRGNKVGLVAFSGEGTRPIPEKVCANPFPFEWCIWYEEMGIFRSGKCIPFQLDITDDAEALHQQIDQYQALCWTCIACGIDAARLMLERGGGKDMILMSDGTETHRSHISGKDALEAARTAADEGIRIHTIALGEAAYETTLTRIATLTGGEFYKVSCVKSLDDIYRELAERIDGNAVLVSDLSNSMYENFTLNCSGFTKYFLAEQLIRSKDQTKSTVIVDTINYAEAVNLLLERECFHRIPEVMDCYQDCNDPRCNCPCDPDDICTCCPRCSRVSDYYDCIYKKYEYMYSRPYVDYLFCYRTPLKDTPWCHQKSSLSTSVINYPWYSFTAKSGTSESEPRSLDKITEEYLTSIGNWNRNVEIKEIPDDVPKKVLKPEIYCDHNFDNKLFRSVWAKIFTVTPFLSDSRNGINWTRTGMGELYAGGGFRREPSCYWECCRPCAPFCDCRRGDCILAYFGEGVENTIKIVIPNSEIYEGNLSVNKTKANEWIIDNGAIKIISSGNLPFEIPRDSVTFEKDEEKGEYITKILYKVANNRKQFTINQDITLRYNLSENATEFKAGIEEEFETSLGVAGRTINTKESISDTWGGVIDISEPQIDALKEAIIGFIQESLERGNKIGMVAFSCYWSWEAPHCPLGIYSELPLTSNERLLYDEVRKYRPLWGTCIPGGLKRGIELIEDQPPGQRYMILMSDGKSTACLPQCIDQVEDIRCSENISKEQAKQQARIAASKGIVIHTLALGNTADEELLEEIAKITNGKFYKIECANLLTDIYKKLAENVNNTILISDVSGSMGDDISIHCEEKGPSLVHKELLDDINLSIEGDIQNIEDGLIKVKGIINITVDPDISNRIILNMGNSSIEHLSLIYPVKHELYRKKFASGPEKKTYTFVDGYGYENKEFNYPEQCRKICPLDCTCPEDDITDVTCIDENGNKYKRTDCVCLPPKGHSYKFPCTSDRTFHEDEVIYYDFVDLTTFETSDLKAVDRSGPNTLSTGDLSGNVIHIMRSKLSPEKLSRILIYYTGDEPTTLVNILEDEGYKVDIISGDERITEGLLSDYGQFWFIDELGNTQLSGSEINAIANYQQRGGNILISGRNNISDKFGVDMKYGLSGIPTGCIEPEFIAYNPLKGNITRLSATDDDVAISTSNILIQIIARGDPRGLNYPMILIMDQGGGGRMVFDNSYSRFLDPDSCDNRMYVLNIANWFKGTGISGEGVKGIYIINFTAMSFPYPLDYDDLKNASVVVFTHFRNDTKKQTFPLFPPRDGKNLHINVTIHNHKKINYTVNPGPYDIPAGSNVRINITLIDAITNETVPNRNILVEVPGYGISEILTTDENGEIEFNFDIGNHDSVVRIIYDDGYQHLTKAFYLSVSSLDILWWFLSPDVLLLVIILVLLAFSYKWFTEGRLDLYGMWDEIRGKK
ncbi:MAG: hypothetical protein DRO76_00435 [Candidatus Altiarchaeales archaeon]|nr:MAG: hypothetical protein DRO76_00435 [Candidatus Altiarchaeales archaeon]